MAAAAALGTGGLLAACGDDDDEPASTGPAVGAAPSEPLPITVMMPFPLGINFIADVAAESGGYMEDAGVDLDLQFARSAPQALQQLAAGNVTVIRNGPVEMIQAIVNEGAPFVSIGMVNQRTNYTLVSAPDARLGMADLGGKAVGMPTLAGNAEFTLDLLLKAAGVDPTTVRREAVGDQGSSYALLEEGRIDSLFVSRSTVAGIKALGEDPHVDLLEDVNPLLGTALVSTTQYIEERRDAIVAYLRGLHAAMLDLDDEAKVAELIPQVRADWDLPQLDNPEQAKPVIAAVTSRWFEDGEENVLRNLPDRWETGVAELAELGYLPAGVEATDLYTNDLLDEALS